MSNHTATRLRTLLALALITLIAAPLGIAADLVWTPETGWKSEGGILTGLTGPDGRNALALMNAARKEEEAGKTKDAIKSYERVGKRYGNSIYAPEAMYRAATLRFERNEFPKAFTDYQTVVSRYPNTTRFNQIIGEQYIIAAAYLNGARSPFLWIFPGFTNREKAIQYFETILFNAPYSEYAPLCLMHIAAGHQRIGNTNESLYALDRLINNYGHSTLTPEAYIKIADIYASLVDGADYDQGATKEAVTYYEDFMILYPNDPHIIQAEKGLRKMKEIMAQSKINIADFYFKKRANYKAARVFYNEAITVFPDSDIAARARKRLEEVEVAAAKATQTPKKKKKKFLGIF
ncbi:outer membrane protein assembly factor BamD [Ereboglobus sp. PH5-5]|uniref:outer membrane protein assembly factor BamD n=1 Tax=Ereboglobus sp. PH5-5 TaxID=2940529 RepID=UPI0024064B3D|nr:outer membrane protein assembly factor BamD [Ereboglobus sp. PH5-5]MDF9831921.1 outer membrane protein assembly factor BamD [Ereboglobus sp. PH5-5]